MNAMTADDAQSLRASFSLVIERAPDFAARFYACLFTQSPHLLPLFHRNSAREQHKVFEGAFRLLFERIDDTKWLEMTLVPLGNRHAGFGVKDEMYGEFRSALLLTVAEVLGADWTETASERWNRALELIETMMIRGATAPMTTKPKRAVRRTTVAGRGRSRASGRRQAQIPALEWERLR